ncbi:ABC transporter permease [Pyxidicoccus fallax]|uniref:ABC transporter permease n=1 Tax=Pyxidicoccus fallax TaxID=394095 RepID=A0A848M0B5_9BACT|nr:ABC transporter permease [Pyxidicoccus fallax]NMO23319.1 ABC transporter permease [Pyxidicoccus fallax]NPC84336.1 ABC transporter permease [Pyxidicoccus fallax]
MSQLLQDVRLSLRRMRREFAFTFVVVATLALAIGATTAVFSVVYQVLLRPLPYPEPARLVRLFQSTPQRERMGVSLLAVQAWRERAHAFQGIEGLTLRDFTLLGDGPAERVRSARATAGLLPLLGVRPVLGQAFGAESEVPGRDQVVLLGHGLWQRRFGGRPDVVGRTLLLDGNVYTVQGVLPADFRFAPDVDLWTPLAPNPAVSAEEEPARIFMRVVARLRPGVTVDAARSELEALAASLAREPAYAELPAGARLLPLHAHMVEKTREQLWLLAGVVALVLLVACANVANLLLARASAREREVSVRAALGAGRAQLMRQFLVESGLLALAGGASGLVLTLWGMDLMRALMPGEVLPAEAVRLEPHVLAIAALLSLLTSFMFGLVPAMRAARADGRGALGGLRGGRGATGQGRARAALVVAQVALALVPLVGAGLMLRTLHSLYQVPLGFEPRGITVADVFVPREKYRDDASRRLVLESLLERVRGVPGVESAGLASTVPLWGRTGVASVLLPGEDEAVAKTRELALFRTATDGYLATLDIPVKEGRGIEPTDRQGTAPVAVVNEAFARRYFPGRSAVGQRVKLALDGEDFREVVGVVGDVHHDSLGEEPDAEIYMPAGQFPVLYMLLTVRSTQDAATLAPVIREQLRAVDPDMPLVQVRSMVDVVDASLGRTQVLGTLLATLAVLGLVLAGVGLYGVLAYSVSQRTRELGIRVALGATDGQLVWLVVGHGLRLAAVGVVLGLAGAAVLARSLSGLLYGVGAFDVFTFVAVPSLLGAVALLASWLPARRALSVPPHEALRAED